MALPVTIPNAFANATASIPLSQLDTNFNTLANAVNGISDGSETLANVTATVVNATTVDTTNIEVTNIKAKDGTSAGSIADSTGVVTLASSVLTTTDINGGTIDGTAIGGSTPAAGSFTTLNTSGQVVFNDAGADVDFRVEGDTDANLLFVDASTDRVGIGTSSPSVELDVSGTLAVRNASTSYINTYCSGGGNRDYQIGVNGSAFVFNDITSGTSERMRIDSSGNLLVGATSFGAYGTLNSYTNAATPAGRFVSGPSTADGNIALMVDKYSSTNTTSQWFLGFTINNQTTASGVITANGASQAAFGTWSDRRLKENIVDLEPQLANICALRPVEFDYIESEGGGHQISFIAQEFEEVYPDAVGERSDGMKTLTGWDKTTARLVKAIQELKAELDTVKAELATLKGQ